MQRVATRVCQYGNLILVYARQVFCFLGYLEDRKILHGFQPPLSGRFVSLRGLFEHQGGDKYLVIMHMPMPPFCRQLLMRKHNDVSAG